MIPVFKYNKDKKALVEQIDWSKIEQPKVSYDHPDHNRLWKEYEETMYSRVQSLRQIDTSNEAIIREAADIANFAMMIADIYGKQFDAVHTTSQPSPPDTGLREALEKIVNMSEDNGRAGCTWGDTEYDSLSVAFGYNLCVSNVKDIATEALNPTANVHDTPNKEK